MKNTLVLATCFVAAAGAVGAGAIHFATNPYAGSDTEFLLQNQAIENSGLGNTGWNPTSATQDYAGGGSGGAENAMTGVATQQTGPMSRMLKGGAGVNACAAPYNVAGALANASGIVIGIDAARVFASSAIVNNAAANGTVGGGTSCVKAVGGLAYDNANGNPMVYPAGQLPFQNWRDVLALLYGGLDKDDGLCSALKPATACDPYAGTGTDVTVNPTGCGTCNPITDCSSTRRQNLISNWGNLFENGGVAGSSLALCGDQVTTCGPNGSKSNGAIVPVGGACADGSTCTAFKGLRHAFRRDDNSGTSDVFSSLIGIQGASVDQYNNKIGGFSVSSEAASSFGSSPYCNALNWDTSEVSNKACVKANVDKHYQGPGGLVLSIFNDANCQIPAAGGAVTAVTCHHVPPFTCGVQGYCNDAAGLACPTIGAACGGPPTDGICVAGTDNRCPAGQTVVTATYGSMPVGVQAAVFPTSYQDNDPLRTLCLETGAKNHPGEDVCNTDGKLGVVLPIPPLDFIADQNPGVNGYTAQPVAATTCQKGTPLGQHNTDCNLGSIAGDAPTVYTCAPKAIANNGPCPNNDPALAIGCLIPTGASGGGSSTSQCQANNATATGCFTGQTGAGGTPCGIDGRIYNEQGYDGHGIDTDRNAHYVNFTVGGVAVNYTGAYGRIHQRETALIAAGLSVCQIGDATQNLGCLVQADPNSVSFGGNTGDVWEGGDPLSTGACAGETSGLRVHEVGAGIACVPSNAGPANNYPIWRKLYINSEKGFANVTAPNEQELVAFESEAQNMDPIMTQYGEFAIPFSPNTNPANSAVFETCTVPGPQICIAEDGNAAKPIGTVCNGTGTCQIQTTPSPAPFCEDFNEYLNGCSAVAAGAGPGNKNGCASNAAIGLLAGFGTIASDPSDQGGNGTVQSPNGDANPAATTSTICGNGLVEDFEDCDPGTTTAQGEVTAIPANLPAGCGSCSTTCRCSLL